MVPVEDSAGRAAAVFHKPHTEGTPKQNADNIADVKCRCDNKHEPIIDKTGEKMEHTDADDECCPHKANFYSVAVALYDVLYKTLTVNAVNHGLKAALEEFL